MHRSRITAETRRSRTSLSIPQPTNDEERTKLLDNRERMPCPHMGSKEISSLSLGMPIKDRNRPPRAMLATVKNRPREETSQMVYATIGVQIHHHTKTGDCTTTLTRYQDTPG